MHRNCVFPNSLSTNSWLIQSWENGLQMMSWHNDWWLETGFGLFEVEMSTLSHHWHTQSVLDQYVRMMEISRPSHPQHSSHPLWYALNMIFYSGQYRIDRCLVAEFVCLFMKHSSHTAVSPFIRPNVGCLLSVQWHLLDHDMAAHLLLNCLHVELITLHSLHV